MAKGDGLIAAARARVVLPATAGLYGAATLAHAGHASTAEVALGAGLATAVAYGTRLRPAAVPIGAAGALFAATAAFGPLAGPDHALAITWSVAALAALIAAHRHPAVREAKRTRAARRAFLAEAHPLGIRGAHLLSREDTRLGERWELDVTGTGALASHIARNGGLAERIAQNRGLPKSRVRVTEGAIAGRVIVSVRFRGPWDRPIPHPLFTEDHEIALPVPCTVTEPITVGQDPETGAPLEMVLWDKHGAKMIMVVAQQGGGKDVLLNNVRERVTAAEDADLWQINVSKAQEERAVEEACEPGYSACGPEAYERARAILFAGKNLIIERGKRRRDKATFRPTKTDRLKVLIINEIDSLLDPELGDPSWVRAVLKFITSKGRSEGVVLIVVGQRATTHWIGGTDVKANINYVAVGRVQNSGEVNHAVGRIVGATLPDMATYGEGKPGVWCIVASGGTYQLGRTFELPADEDLTVMRDLARKRSPGVPAMAGTGKLPTSNLLAGNPSPGEDQPPEPPPLTPGEPPNSLDRLDAELMRDLPTDLREQLGKTTGRNAETKRILDETAALPPPPEVDQEQRAKITSERWRVAAEKTVIPDDARAKLLALLTGDGMSGRKITECFPDVKRWKVMLWLNRLRFEGIAAPDGKGAGARWVRTERDEK